MSTIDEFIYGIASENLPTVFNPWAEVSPDDAFEDAADERRYRLRAHMNCNPKLLLIGEAPGYQGCRYSGIAFTSERLLYLGQIPRVESYAGRRITFRERPWSEPSATIVWGALYELGLQAHTVMFNAVPWHPQGLDGIHSNRTPSAAERHAGIPHLLRFISLYEGAKIAALGNTASKSLYDLGIEHAKLRHPANGGATKFRDGLKALEIS